MSAVCSGSVIAGCFQLSPGVFEGWLLLGRRGLTWLGCRVLEDGPGVAGRLLGAGPWKARAGGIEPRTV